MPISQETLTQIATLSKEDKQEEIVTLVKEKLKQKEFTASEILDFSTHKIFTQKPGKPYVIYASTINKIAVAIGQLEDKEEAQHSDKFFKLAAERGSSWGNRNYAQVLLNQKKAEEALHFAEKAVELAASDEVKPEEHKLILCRALRANRQYEKANIALIEFLGFQHPGNNIRRKEAIQEGLVLARTIMKEFRENLDNPSEVTTEGWQNNIKELNPFVTAGNWYEPEGYPAIRQEAYYIKGYCHEKLGEYQQAMQCYCKADDKNLPFYKEAVAGRARLLNLQIAKELTKAQSVISPKEAKEGKSGAAEPSEPKAPLEDKEHLSQTSNNEQHMLSSEEQSSEASARTVRRGVKRKFEATIAKLPDETPFPVKFGQKWKSEASWLDSLDERELEEEFNKRFSQLQKLISAKEVELELITESMESTSEGKADNTLLQNKKKLDTSLEQLRALKKELSEQNRRHLPSFRMRHRMEQAQTTFFNPKRSKNKKLVALTTGIIAHRYNVSAQDPVPVTLDNTSTRAVITAESAYQKAIIALSADNKRSLGIPVASSSSWEFGYYSGSTTYGPVECYQANGIKLKLIHRTSPKKQRLGDRYLPEHGTYSRDIYPFLFKLAGGVKEKEISLTKFMLRYGRTHQAPTLAELQSVNPQAEQKDIEQFTRVCFLILESEQAQWHSTTEESHQLGMSVAQAWCLIMLEAGYITMEEVFKNDTLFGVYSQKGIVDNPEKVAESCKRINHLYLKYLQTKHNEDHVAFLKRYVEKGQFPTSVIPRKQMQLDLRYVHGGESDSEDDEGYETDLEMSPKQNRY